MSGKGRRSSNFLNPVEHASVADAAPVPPPQATSRPAIEEQLTTKVGQLTLESHEQIRQQLRISKQEAADARSSLDDIRRQYDSVVKTRDQLNLDNQLLRSEKGGLEAVNSDLERQLGESRNKLAAVEKSSRRHAADMHAKLKSTENLLSYEGWRVVERNTKICDLQQSSRSQYNSLHRRVAALHDKLESTENLFSYEGWHLAERNSQYIDLRRRFLSLSYKLDVTKDRLSYEGWQVADYQTQLHSIHAHLLVRNDELNSVTDLAQRNSQYNSLQSRTDVAVHERDRLLHKYQDLEDETKTTSNQLIRSMRESGRLSKTHEQEVDSLNSNATRIVDDLIYSFRLFLEATGHEVENLPRQTFFQLGADMSQKYFDVEQYLVDYELHQPELPLSVDWELAVSSTQLTSIDASLFLCPLLTEQSLDLTLASLEGLARVARTRRPQFALDGITILAAPTLVGFMGERVMQYPDLDFDASLLLFLRTVELLIRLAYPIYIEAAKRQFLRFSSNVEEDQRPWSVLNAALMQWVREMLAVADAMQSSTPPYDQPDIVALLQHHCTPESQLQTEDGRILIKDGDDLLVISRSELTTIARFVDGDWKKRILFNTVEDQSCPSGIRMDMHDVISFDPPRQFQVDPVHIWREDRARMQWIRRYMFSSPISEQPGICYPSIEEVRATMQEAIEYTKRRR